MHISHHTIPICSTSTHILKPQIILPTTAKRKTKKIRVRNIPFFLQLFIVYISMMIWRIKNSKQNRNSIKRNLKKKEFTEKWSRNQNRNWKLIKIIFVFYFAFFVINHVLYIIVYWMELMHTKCQCGGSDGTIQQIEIKYIILNNSIKISRRFYCFKFEHKTEQRKDVYI